MGFDRNSLGWTCLLLAIVGLTCATERDAMVSSSEDKHENKPRFFGGFFSRPKPEAEKQQSGGLKDHFGNVLKGGSIGFQGEIAPLAHVHGFINQAKNILPKPIIPGFHKPNPVNNPDVGKEPNPWWGGSEDKYDDNKSERGGKIPEEKPKPIEDMEYEGPHDWKPQNPKDVSTNGPRWEDIGEPEDDDNDYTSEPIEAIINPRKRTRSRTKRRVESHVFHVPIQFLSNAKPFSVEIHDKNSFKL